MEVHPSLPVATVPEFIAYAKANPGKINMGSAGNGTIGHVSCELFKMMTGVNMVHVPYRGSAPMLTDLLGGQVQVTIDNVAGSIDHIRTGRLRALAVTTATNASRRSAGSATAKNGAPDARVASAWSSGDMGSTAADTKPRLECNAGSDSA
jgi:tripartite-type tricarboxylate transporter receptor subunit TctC